MFSKVSKFFREVQTELRKATWPWDPKEKGFKKYRQLMDSTLVVLIASLLLGAYVSFNDFVLVHVMKLLTIGL